MLKAVCLAAVAVLDVAAGANGFIMLVSPELWYLAVPGVTTTSRLTSTSSEI